jgi:flagellar protein FlaJ
VSKRTAQSDSTSKVDENYASENSAVNSFFRVSYGLFALFIGGTKSDFLSSIQLNLDKAEIDISSEVYLSGVYFASMLVGIVLVALTLGEYLNRGPYNFVSILIPVSVVLTLGVGFFLPGIKSSSRGKKIDENLGSAFSFISAMSSADVPINAIMLKLSKMKEYGEVSREALKIASRTEILGTDIFTAMQQVAKSSASIEWQKFLQGAVATSTAGARLKPYFVGKATEYQSRLRISLKKNAESVSVFAETYVTVGVAFPLFLIVILAVMSVIARTASGATISFLLLFSFIVLPVMIVTFILLISSVNKEVQIS